MKIGVKLLGFVGACSLTTLIVAGVSVATLNSFEHALTEVEGASIRALNAANFNRLAAEVTMDSRGVYASADRAEAAKYTAGIRRGLAEMDALRADWAPRITAAERPLFDTMTRHADAFRGLRTALAEAGDTTGPRAAAELGFNDANRANRKAFQASIDALVTEGRGEMAAIKADTQALFGARGRSPGRCARSRTRSSVSRAGITPCRPSGPRATRSARSGAAWRCSAPPCARPKPSGRTTSGSAPRRPRRSAPR
jgi:methyl-accepting chemotaxis protein